MYVQSLSMSSISKWTLSGTLQKKASACQGRELGWGCSPLGLYRRKVCSNYCCTWVQIGHINCPNTSTGAEVENLPGFFEGGEV